MLVEMENNCLLPKEKDGRREQGPQSADSAPLVLTLGVVLGKEFSLCVSVPYNQS